MCKYLLYLIFFSSAFCSAQQNIGIGTTSPQAKLDINGDMILESKELIIPDGTIYQLDVNTNKFNQYKLTGPTGNFQIAGITAAEHDRTVALYNRSGVSLEVYNDDINTLPQDRILTGTGGTFAVYSGGNVVLKYDTLIAKWEVISGHYTNLDYYGSAAGEWTENANDIYNINSGNVGIGTITPAAKLTVNGDFALQSDTIGISCDIMPPQGILIDHVVKNKSVLHIVADGCISYFTPFIAGISGGADGMIVCIVSHVNNLPIQHLQGTIANDPVDSVNMIELYEPNYNGAINHPTSVILNNGGAITLIYDGLKSRWKVLGVYGEVKTETMGWYAGADPNNIYNPNVGNVGIGTSIPDAKLVVNGTFKVVDGTQGAGKILTSDATGLASWQPMSSTWNLNGNEGTNSADFIGTTDNQPLRFKVNGNIAGIINPLNDNAAFGYYSLTANTSGNNNSAFGNYALQSNTTGISNSAFGSSALFDNTTGFKNTAVGVGSLATNTSGYSNTAIGFGSMQNNTTGTENLAVGFLALENNTTGNYNAALSPYALQSNTTGNNNTACGHYALSFNSTGYENVAFGNLALSSNSTGPWNTAIGFKALKSNTSGDANCAFGSYSLEHNTTGFSNCAFGYESLFSNTTGWTNCAFGIESLRYNTTGKANAAFGWSALLHNTTGIGNSAFGEVALVNCTTGDSNTAIGEFAMAGNQTGAFNSGVGHYVLNNNLSGNNNTAVGAAAHYLNETGSWNTCVGDYTNTSINNLNGAMALGTSAISNGDNKIVIGKNTPSIVIGGYANWSNLSDGRFKNNVHEDIPGLDFIKELRPVSYTIDINKLQHYITAQMPDSMALHYYPTDEEIREAATDIKTGFIAQEVEAAALKSGYRFDGVNTPKNPTDNYSIAYSQFVMPLVKAVQELSQQNEDLKIAISTQDTVISDLQRQIIELRELVLKLSK